MPFSLDDLTYGIVLPAAAAAFIACVQRLRVTGDSGRRLGTVVPFVLGFHVGYWLLALGPVRPESHWQWLPWLLVMSILAGVPPFSRPAARVPPIVLTIVVAGVSGWLLVPTWAHLEPSRAVYMAAFAVMVILVTTALQPLTVRLPAVWLLGNLTAGLITGAVILALAGSLRFAQMAGCGVAALVGMMVAAPLVKDRMSADGIALPFTLLISAMMLIGRVNSFSDVPLVSYLLPPLAPLSLWLARSRPLANATGVRRWLVLSMPLAVCGVAVGFAAVSELAGDSQW